MSQASASRAQVSLVEELVWGTTPTSPQLKSLPFSTFNISLKKDLHENTSIQADGMARSPVQGNRTTGGDLDAQFSAADFKPLFESVMQSIIDPVTGYLKKGTTRKSFTFQEAETDIQQYTQSKGIVVDKLTLAIPNTGVATVKFSLMGKTMVQTQASLDPTVDVAADQKLLHHSKGVFKEGGVVVGYLSNLTLTVDNGNSTNYGLGSADARDLTTTTQKVTGSTKMFFEDAVMLTKFINGTPSSIEAVLDDGVETFGILLPNVTYSSADKQVSGSGPIELTMNFTASFDSITNTNIRFAFKV